MIYFSNINKDILLLIFSYLEWQEFCNINKTNLILQITLKEYIKVCPKIPTIDEVCSNKKEYLEIIKILLEFYNNKKNKNFEEINKNKNFIKIRTLEKATQNNHINIVKYLCNNKNISLKISICNSMRIASQEGYLEIVKFLHSKNACCISSSIELARMSGHTDVYEYLCNI